jgi:hypothetical protein
MKVDDRLVEQANHADLRALAEQHTQLRRNSRRDWEGACPKCGGHDRFHVFQAKDGRWLWRCYQCHDKPGDAIAFLRWMRPNLSFTDAVAELGGQLPASAQQPHAQPLAQRKPIPRPAAPPAQPAGWRERAEAIVEAAYERLLRGDEGAPGREYLESRGINSESWIEYDLGYRHDVAVPGTEGKERVPAIVMPWYAGGRLVAVRYRFISPQGKRKITAQAGSVFEGRLFGGQKVAPASKRPERFLLLVEGELNCVSVAQACGRYGRLMDFGVDVLSLGHESAKLSPAAIAAAQQYRKVVVWTDQAKFAQELAGSLHGSYPVQSPGGRDANDLLKAGQLSGFIIAVLEDALVNDAPGMDLLLAYLRRSAHTLYGIDAGAASALASLTNNQTQTPVHLVEAWPGRWVTAERLND